MTLATGCSTYSGSIALATSTTSAIVYFDFEEISGDLIIENVPGISFVEGVSLQQVNGTLSLGNLPNLTTLQFDSLIGVGSLKLAGLNAIQTISPALSLKVGETVTVMNTSLESLDHLQINRAQKVYISHNPVLRRVALPIEGAEMVQIYGNFPGIDVDLRRLRWVMSSLIISNPSTVNLSSFGSSEWTSPMSGIIGNIVIQSNTLDIVAFSSTLGFWTKNLFIKNNPLLTEVDFRATTFAQNMTISNNSALTALEFPALESAGRVDASGNLSR